MEEFVLTQRSQIALVCWGISILSSQSWMRELSMNRIPVIDFQTGQPFKKVWSIPVLPSFVHIFMLFHHDGVSCRHINDVPAQQTRMFIDFIAYWTESAVGCITILLCRFGEDGCEQGLFVCSGWGYCWCDPVRAIWGFADRVRVGDQRLAFVILLVGMSNVKYSMRFYVTQMLKLF